MIDLLTTDFMEDFEYPELIPIPPPKRHSDLRWFDVITRLKQWYKQAPPAFKLAHEWQLRVDNELFIIIPRGFVVNGASVPKLLWFLIPPHGSLLIPSIVHDFTYARAKLLIQFKGKQQWIYGKNRRYWDKLFFKISKSTNPNAWRNYAAYLALRFGGGAAWKKYRS